MNNMSVKCDVGVTQDIDEPNKNPHSWMPAGGCMQTIDRTLTSLVGATVLGTM
jgi:hypothetical protein